MKNLYTFILILSGLQLFSQIQLDSVVQFDILTNEVNSKLAFIYEDEKLSRYSESSEDYFVDVDINYNENGDFESWNVSDNGDFGTFDFIYNFDEKLDSLVASYGMSETTILDYLYSDGILNSIRFSDNFSGTYELYVRRDFKYDDDLISRFTDFDITDIEESIEFITELEYDSEERLTRLIRSDESEIYQVDSLSYDEVGSIKDLFTIDYSNGVPDVSNKTEDYTSDAEISFDNILNPIKLIRVINLYGNEQNRNSYYPMEYGNKVDQAITNDYYYGESMTQWYYSGLVGTNERVVTTPISVYPNPTVDRIRIESEDRMTKFYIYDVNGALISEGIPENNNTIDVFQLSTGNYTVICSNQDDMHYFAQFVKQ